MTETTKVAWHNARQGGINGRGWDDTRSPYERLPARAEGVVREPVWNLSLSPAGMTVRFETDAAEIRLRWTLGDGFEYVPRFSRLSRSGFDLYAYDGQSGCWRWVGITAEMNENPGEGVLVSGLDGRRRLFELYLPLSTALIDLEIGVPAAACYRALPVRPERPIVYYGTSIVHGAGVTRAGMCLTSILSRRLDLPVINLGFAGNAKMEPEIATLLAELSPRLFILDALPNMDRALVEQNAEAFVRTLRAARPATPLVLIEDRTWTNAWIRPELRCGQDEKRAAFRAVADRLRDEGLPGLSLIAGERLFGTDDEGTVDGSHPSDLGCFRMIDAIEPAVRAALQRF